ncbi:MAG: bifunctional DNA primase/polymerase [Planctomycetota bacterium]
MTTATIPHLDAALGYGRQGKAVFPLRPRSKAPLPKSNGYLDATQSETEIAQHWNRRPEANIGMPTGEVNGCFVVDIDPRHGGPETWGELIAEHGHPPETAEQTTGSGGTHYVFRHPGFRVKCGSHVLGPGVDIKGDGGYIVVAPSIHPGGGEYVWENSRDPVDAPQWILDALQSADRPTTSAPEGTEADLIAALAHLPYLSAEKADDHDTWIKVGMALHWCDTEADAFEAWEDWSRQSDSFREGECAKRWASFHAKGTGQGKRVTVGTIIKWAREDGAPDDLIEDDPVASAWQQQAGETSLETVSSEDQSDPRSESTATKTPAYLTGTALADQFLTGLTDGFGFDTIDTSFLNAPMTGDDSRILAGRGLVSLFGGPPGAGKSALVESIVWHLAQNDPSFRILIANVELSPWMLLARQIQRTTEIPARRILSQGSLNTAERENVEYHIKRLAPALDRICIVPHVSTIGEVAKAAHSFEADLLVLDYIQRIAGDTKADSRESLNKAMSVMRRAADSGRAVLAVSALSRSKGTRGSSYADSTSLASFRESSEVEYGADFACIMTPDSRQVGAVRIGVVKNRWGELGQYGAMFDGPSLTWSIGNDVYGGGHE